MGLDLSMFLDDKFHFEPESHTYTYDGEMYRSASSIVDIFSHPFNAETEAIKFAEKNNKTTEEVLKDWKYAGTMGTAVHKCIENFYTGRKVEFLDEEVELRFKKWLALYKEKLQKFVPVSHEQMVFSHRYKIAGTIDTILANKNYLMLADWKTNKNLSDWGFKRMYPPFDSYFDSKFSKYSIQLAIYELILNEYGMETRYSFLAHLPPKKKPAQIIRVYERIPEYKVKLRQYLDHELDQLDNFTKVFF